ncbi:RcnB family protein [Acinetobacter tianfuensis]|uniref:RcnB family protein n=1 Tax=Acinetobacter tianfuensis TaxID=2419603 RepID=A0A3A8E4W9_9GAMM|nr:RcnB family protein [Acinetobacter tianfuensis]RKG30112.1 hypothetical protein D7V32_12350 [Acinetobacter tianfuensis]
MKKILTAAAIALTGLISASAMAAPDHRYDHQQSYAHQKHHDSRWDERKHNHWQQSRVNPSREWRKGQTLPRAFNSSQYRVSEREARRLPDTGRYQQWYKINGDYVLINKRNDRIVRIIG